MDKKDLLDYMEYYFLNEFVKKRTSVKNNTYFYVEDKDHDPYFFDDDDDGKPTYLVYAYYSKNDKTLYLYLPVFNDNNKFKTIPTYDGKNKTINGVKILNLVVEWFKDKFPELDIKRIGRMMDYMFEGEIPDRFKEDMVDIGPSDISEEIKRIKELLK